VNADEKTSVSDEGRRPIMRLAWLTDIHLNFVDALAMQRFFESVAEQADAVAISGDIAESHDVYDYLRRTEEIVQKPIFFVLGNHDFYQGSISQVRRLVSEAAEESKYLKYLTAMGVEALTPRTAIIGHDGWADGRLGDYDNSDVILNDHLLIAELAVCWNGVDLDKRMLRPILAALADEAARHFQKVLEAAATQYPNVIAVTHVPPFREAAWYQGKTSDDSFLPHFASKVVGEVMKKVMQAHPQSKLLVLCGHTHGGGEIKVLDNLRVLTGEAEYGKLRINGILPVE
jgi:predicted MPP superfamily phosphohydrolase